MKTIPGICFVVAAAIFCGCNSMPARSHGPIVLGDSSTIVTENDPDKLRDMVTDLQPVASHAKAADTTGKPDDSHPDGKPADTAHKKDVPVAHAADNGNSGNALRADFGVVSVVIPYVTAKLSGNPNLARASGAVYSFTGGNLAGSVIQVPGTVTRVSQRYQTIIVVKNELGTLPLETLGTTTAWEPLKGSNNVYKIAGLDEKSLEFADANRNGIRNAVVKSVRRHRINRRRAAEWEESVRNARSVKQRPLSVMLRSVMWKIDGKDAGGKAFSRQVRLDMPL